MEGLERWVDDYVIPAQTYDDYKIAIKKFEHMRFNPISIQVDKPTFRDVRVPTQLENSHEFLDIFIDLYNIFNLCISENNVQFRFSASISDAQRYDSLYNDIEDKEAALLAIYMKHLFSIREISGIVRVAMFETRPGVDFVTGARLLKPLIADDVQTKQELSWFVAHLGLRGRDPGAEFLVAKRKMALNGVTRTIQEYVGKNIKAYFSMHADEPATYCLYMWYRSNRGHT